VAAEQAAIARAMMRMQWVFRFILESPSSKRFAFRPYIIQGGLA
jgi:hypothetical protein